MGKRTGVNPAGPATRLRRKTIATIMTMADTAQPGVATEPDLAYPGSAGLLKLLAFLSPAFPVGSFSYSHGLEWLIDTGAIGGSESLRDWLIDLIEVGSFRTDAALFAEAYRASAACDWARLADVADLAEALAPSRERHLETMAQGRAFLQAACQAWRSEPLHRLMLADGAAYPAAVAAAAASHGIPLAAALPAFLNAAVANLVSVGVRLVPLGQSAGLKVLAALHPLLSQAAAAAIASDLDDLGSATMLSDIAAMRHEEQYSRVFRT